MQLLGGALPKVLMMGVRLSGPISLIDVLVLRLKDNDHNSVTSYMIRLHGSGRADNGSGDNLQIIAGFELTPSHLMHWIKH